MIRSLPSSDRKWKTKFFFVSGSWAGNPSDVGRDTFGPYTRDLGNFRPKGKCLFVCLFFFFGLTCSFTAVGQPSLSKFHRDCVHRARLHADKNFHSLVTLR